MWAFDFLSLSLSLTSLFLSLLFILLCKCLGTRPSTREKSRKNYYACYKLSNPQTDLPYFVYLLKRRWSYSISAYPTRFLLAIKSRVRRSQVGSPHRAVLKHTRTVAPDWLLGKGIHYTTRVASRQSHWRSHWRTDTCLGGMR